MLLLFAGLDCYPEGGWKDCRGRVETPNDVAGKLAELIEKEKGAGGIWWHVANTETNRIVAEGRIKDA